MDSLHIHISMPAFWRQRLFLFLLWRFLVNRCSGVTQADVDEAVRRLVPLMLRRRRRSRISVWLDRRALLSQHAAVWRVFSSTKDWHLQAWCCNEALRILRELRKLEG